MWTSAASTPLVLCSLAALVVSISAFEYSGYCTKMCMWGRGGNLCKCSAVHFAGKRTGSADEGGDSEAIGGVSLDDGDQEKGSLAGPGAFLGRRPAEDGDMGGSERDGAQSLLNLLNNYLRQDKLTSTGTAQNYPARREHFRR